jgi:2-oxoisovalerate dehydrogenase E2 component (dihydrolipoyl transacylase)
MIYHLTIPDMGGTEELRVLQWHRREGEPLASDELLLELETEKAVVEVRTPQPCVVRKIAVAQGEWARVGAPIVWLSDSPEEALDTGEARDFVPRWEIL